MDNNSANTTKAGRVAFFAEEKHFGFIEPEDGEPVYFNLRDCAGEYLHVHAGDKVTFEYDDKEGRPCARRVHFLGNASLDGLRTDFEQSTVLQGFVKRIEGSYYVKDVETHIFIKLAISPNEVDTEEIYEGSLNQRRDYQLTRVSAHNSLRAVLTSRRFKPGLAELVSGQAYEAEVVGDVIGGYLLRLVALDIIGLLPCKDVFKQTIPLAIGVRVEVQLQSGNFTVERLVFELANDSKGKFLSLPLLAEGQAKKLSALSLGFIATGTVKSVLNFGAFVALESFGDALLHIKLFLPLDCPDHSRAEKQALGDLLAELLPPKTELRVVVIDIDGARCSVDLDMSVASNVALKAQFSQRYRQLLGA